MLKQTLLTFLTCATALVAASATSKREPVLAGRPVDVYTATHGVFDAIDRRDLDGLSSFFDPNITLKVAFSYDGKSQNPGLFLTGKQPVADYLGVPLELFDVLHFVDINVNVANGGRTTFVQANGNMSIFGLPYNNVYIFRFDWTSSGLITNYTEYNNPIVFCGVFADPGCLPALLPPASS